MQHMQKAMALMNIQLSTVIADVVGQTGQKIIRAIVDGERDPQKLAALRGSRIQASEDQVARSLEGTWRHEHVFALKQALQAYDFVRGQMHECDVEIERQMQVLKMTDAVPGKRRRRSTSKNAPTFDVHERLYQVTGVDLTRINGLDSTTVLTIISEVGTDLSRFPTSGHFASWLGVCPGTRITGGKVLSSRTKPVNNRATQALKMAAANLRKSNSALGASCRRMCARMDTAKAITAVAHKLARPIYAMLTKGQEFVDRGQDFYEQRHQEHMLTHLRKRALKMGFSSFQLPTTHNAHP